MIRGSRMDLFFCPSKVGARDALRVKNALAHYAELLGIPVTKLDGDAIGSQFD